MQWNIIQYWIELLNGTLAEGATREPLLQSARLNGKFGPISA